MSKSRHKPKNLLRTIERLMQRAADRRVRDDKRILKSQPVQDSFARFYLD
jgi:hypothetical protein